MLPLLNNDPTHVFFLFKRLLRKFFIVVLLGYFFLLVPNIFGLFSYSTSRTFPFYLVIEIFSGFGSLICYFLKSNGTQRRYTQKSTCICILPLIENRTRQSVLLPVSLLVVTPWLGLRSRPLLALCSRPWLLKFLHSLRSLALD